MVPWYTYHFQGGSSLRKCYFLRGFKLIPNGSLIMLVVNLAYFTYHYHSLLDEVIYEKINVAVFVDFCKSCCLTFNFYTQR